MFKKILLFTTTLLFVSGIALGKDKVAKKAVIDNGVSLSKVSNQGPVVMPWALNYVAVDTMANSYGPGSATINPLAYDPYSNVVAYINRGSGSHPVAGSGNIWYSVSTDGGITWARVNTPVNTGVSATGRYPSMALSNPTKSADAANVTALFGWPILTSSFANFGYGVDQPVGSGQILAVEVAGPSEAPYGSNVPTFVSDQTDWYYWVVDNQGNNNSELFRTEAFNSVLNATPANWTDEQLGSNGSIALGGVVYNDVAYYGLMAAFPDSIAPGGWEVGYSKSTDHGATWSDWNVINWTLIPATASYTQLWDWKPDDGNTISYSGDINVDKDGYVHIVTGLSKDVDTTTGMGTNAIVEFFETASGWDAKIISEGADAHNKTYYYQGTDNPGIGQMGFNPMIATNKTRDAFVVTWVMGASQADSVADIFMSSRTLNGNWTARTNLTNTPDMNETGCHLAAMMGGDGPDYTAMLAMWYEAGNTTAQYTDTNPAVVYVTPVTVNIVTDVEDNVTKAERFALAQNFPNPFNPTTNIRFSIPEANNVSLKVFDMLGKEVATLVNGYTTAGSHDVTLNAASLSSGLYIYKLTAGEYSVSRKMMLLK